MFFGGLFIGFAIGVYHKPIFMYLNGKLKKKPRDSETKAKKLS